MHLQWTFVIACFSLAFLAEGQGILKEGFLKQGETRDVLDTLLADSVQKNGAEKTKSRLAEVEAFLHPMYKALPRATRNGPHVTALVARYALHRYFEQRYGWFLRGEGPAGRSYVNTKDEQSATATLDAFLAKSEEGHNDGVSLHGLASVAIALEDIIFQDIRFQIKQSYTTIGLFRDLEMNPELELDRLQLDRLVSSYMVAYMSGAEDFNVTEQGIQFYRAFMMNNSRSWLETEEWMLATYVKVMDSLGYSDDVLGAFNMSHVEKIVKELILLYNGFNEAECVRVKARLLTMEDRHTGRVSLADFYREGLSGTWQFNEKVEYLRDIGALDESKHRQPRVIVANYISSWANCMDKPKHYAVCCRNPCERIMDQLERQIQAPTAVPDQIKLFVERGGLQASNSSVSNMTILEERLEHIAARHDGLVPLHGRLFAQWLHHAAPQECPYPHEKGTINPQAPSEWMEEKGLNDLKATTEEMMNYISVGVNGNIGARTRVHSEDQAENDVPWTDKEELMVVRTVEPSAPRLQTGVFALSDYVALLFELFAVGTLVAATVRFSRSRFYRMRLKKARCSDKAVDA